MTYRRILVAIDASPTAERALLTAIDLARNLGSALLITSVHDSINKTTHDTIELLNSAKSRAAERELEASCKLQIGDPASLIMEFADREKADLLVLGNKGMSGSRRFLLGSVPNKVSHNVICDLLIVNTTNPSRSETYERLLLATDGSPSAEEAVRKGYSLASAFEAHVSLLYCGFLKTAEMILKETSDSYAEGVPTTILPVEGDPADQICEAAEQGIDLLVMGSRGMSGARRFVLGSVPNKVSHHSPTDLLIVRTDIRVVDLLEPGEGGIVEIGGQKKAVYKDEEGALHVLNASCTHMGCTVGWNGSERTWDCPCHGSRYALDGSVINGPAVKRLRREIYPGAVPPNTEESVRLPSDETNKGE